MRHGCVTCPDLGDRGPPEYRDLGPPTTAAAPVTGTATQVSGSGKVSAIRGRKCGGKWRLGLGGTAGLEQAGESRACAASSAASPGTFKRDRGGTAYHWEKVRCEGCENVDF